MRARAAVLFCACFAVAPSMAAQSNLAVTLHVTVDGVKPGGGTLRVGLHDEVTFSIPNAKALREQDISNVAGDVSLQFDRMPPGSYAIKAFQDVNKDGTWEPGEPQAVSNGAAANDFDSAALLLMPGNNEAVIHLK
jgi:uncharacterized protein (DUF2141 family)